LLSYSLEESVDWSVQIPVFVCSAGRSHTAVWHTGWG